MATVKVQRALEAARAYRAAKGADLLNEFAGLLAIPNDEAAPAELHRNADWLLATFKKRQVRTELLKIPSAPPLVYGELHVPEAARTLGLYVHYDGQPTNEGRWTHPPFQPTFYTDSLDAGGQPQPLPAPGEPVHPNGRLYARSASDDKAPFGALLGALDALHAAQIPLTSNVKFLFDGEEERSSPNLATYLDLYGESYDDVDLWLFLDGPVHPSRRPQLVFGARGIAGMEIVVYGAVRPLHSGHYSNWAPMPGARLAQLLASMQDADGEVLIDGFYADTAPVTDAEWAALQALPPYDDLLREELGLVPVDRDGNTRYEAFMRPSLTVRGLESGSVGKRARNVIPAYATASIGLRLAKGDRPDAMLDRVEAHIRHQGYHIVRVTPDHKTRLQHPFIARVVREMGYPATRTLMDLPAVQPIIAAMEAAAGEAPLHIPTFGASMPLYMFAEVLGKPVVVVPIANHDNNQHAPDENLRIANLWYGIDLYAALLTI